MTGAVSKPRLDTQQGVMAYVLSVFGRGYKRDIVDSAFAGDAAPRDLFGLEEIARLLGFSTVVTQKEPEAWRDGRDGALVVFRDGKLVAQIRIGGRITTVAQNDDSASCGVQDTRGMLYLEPVSATEFAEVTYVALAQRARLIMRHGFWQSLAINLCALTVPFFTMAVYDRVLGGAAVSSLPALLSGAVLVLAVMFFLRRIRARMLASEFARLGASISMALSQRLFRQPFLARNRADTEAVLARLRQGERAADVFANSNVSAIFDAPFILLTLIALVIVGGVLAVVPALYLLIFLFIGLVLGWARPSSDPVQARLASRHRALVNDLNDAALIRQQGVSSQWLRQFDQLSRAAARAGHAAQLRPGMVQSIGTSLGTGAALVTLIIGLDLAIQGKLSPGVLIGTMLLTWRITGPAQGLFLALPRLRVVYDAWSQLRSLLSLPVLWDLAHLQDAAPDHPVPLTAENLFLRYANGADAAVSGVSFEIPPGAVVGVIGPNGSGKTTLLRMLAGVLEAQSGRLLMDGRSYSHFGADSMAERIAYLPSDPHAALTQSDYGAGQTGISEVEAENLAWDAVTSRDAPAYVLDDPLAVGGDTGRTRIVEFVNAKRGAATVILATHDTDLMPLCDMAIVLDHGTLAYAGPVTSPEDSADENEQLLTEETTS